MNILITDQTNDLRRFIPQSSIAHIEFNETHAWLEVCDHINGQRHFYVVGNSRSRLIHAIEMQADSVYLAESQFLNEREFKQWQQQPQPDLAGLPQAEIAGLLEASELYSIVE